MTDAELDALVARLREPDTHDPACPFSRHCYCGDAIHDNVSDDDKLEAAAALTTLRKQRDELREALKHAAWELTDKGHDREAAVARQALSNMEGE